MKKKQCFALEIHLDFCFSEIHRFHNLWCHHRHDGINIFAYFFLILSTTKMKFGQVLVCCMTNISNIFLIQWWRLETSSRPFYDFIEMTKKRGLAICNSWQLPFLIVSFSPFQKYQALKSWRNWLLSNWSRLPNWKEPGT